MKRIFLFLLSLLLVFLLAACQSQPTERLPSDGSIQESVPTGVPGEPTGVPENQING